MCSVKRENNSVVLTDQNIILDIEGTTTSITFVKDVLFPYVRKHLEAFLKENWDSDVFQAILRALRIQASEDKEKKLDGVIDIPENGEKDDLFQAVIKNVLWQMDLDSKAKSLKDLQGLIMEEGYKKGELKGHVYEDFEPNLKLWAEMGKNVYIYSSGSVHAQKLLYGHSEKGDLLPYIKGHFDTTVGKKGEAESYKKILEQISGSPSETVFFTDVPKEAKAAKEAGLSAILVSRDGNAPLTEEDKQEFQVIKSFSEIQFDNNSKKRKICTESDTEIDNKVLESCEVSLEPLKESTPSTLTQQLDVNMEVEESCNQETNGNIGKSDEKPVSENSDAKPPQHEDSKNGDPKVKLATKVEDGNESVKDKNGTEEGLQQNETVPEKLESVNKEQNEVIEDKPSKSVGKNEEERAECINGNRRDSPSEVTSVSSNDNQQNEEKTCQEENQEINEPSQNAISLNGKTEFQAPQENSSSDIQPNGTPTSNSVDEAEDNCDIKGVMDNSIEKQNNKPELNPDANDEEQNQCSVGIVNDTELHTIKNGQISDKKLSDSEQVPSKGTDPSETNMDVDDEPCQVNSDGDKSDLTSPKDNVPMDLDGDADKPTQKSVDNSHQVSESESVNEPLVISSLTVPPSSKNITPVDQDAETEKPNSMSVENSSISIVNGSAKSTDLPSDSTKFHSAKEISSEAVKTSQISPEVTKKDSDITEKIQSDSCNGEEISSESMKGTEIEVNAAKSDDADPTLKPCVGANADEALSGMPNETQIDDSDIDKAKSGKREMGEENGQKNDEVKEVSEKKSDGGVCSLTPKDAKLDCSEPNTAADIEKMNVAAISTESQSQPDSNKCSQQISPEPCTEEKTDITKLTNSSCAKSVEESAANVKNDGNDDDVDQLNKNDKSEMTVNGKVGESSKSVESDNDNELKNKIDDNELKNKIDENPVCEVKKLEVPENTVITTVVEA